MSYLTESLKIEILMMIGYGDRARTQCEVVRLFREKHPDLPPLNQGTISKIEAQYREMGHVRKVPSKRQAVVDDDTKLNLLLALEENPITPARQLARDSNLKDKTVLKILKYEKKNAHIKCKLFKSYLKMIQIDGWSYQEVLPYFLKSEGARLENADSRYHNTKGYLSVEESYKSTLTETFLQGGEEMGLPSIDYNSPTKSFGLSSMQSTLRNGRRESVARAFLYPASNRTNLHILTGAFVRKILINGGTAYGVTYEKGGKIYTVTAKKEVIVSAGCYLKQWRYGQHPQLLMLSGLGPKSHLEELGIRCLKDLSVGRNLQDHLIFPGVVYSIPFDGDQTITRLTGSFLDYVHSGTGLFTMLGGVTGLGFVKTEVSKVKADQPDIEFMFVQGSLASGFGNFIKSMLGMKEEFYDETFLPLEGGYQWTIAPVLLHPKSIGSIELRSRNPHDQPLIKPDYFSDPENEDIRTMIAGIREIQKLTNTTAFKIRGADLNELAVPGCADFAFDSDGYWECSLRSMAYTIYHPIGTAKMGPRYDRTAVVNHRLQVYGIKNLRVADCSVIPSHISGHTNAAAVMIGEKASDYIKESWGR
ncbi:hypothetical protein NQ318_002303, partial [Aromia moschata]